jgi:hypothetical protein
MTNTDVGDDNIPPMKEAVRDNLDELRVSPIGGALVATFAQQVDYAKQMSRGRLSLPSFLAGNVGDCLAVVNISLRFGFDPYMVASQTYDQGGRLCYMAQLVHAMIECSGRLSRRLRADYEGEGDERRCIVTGWIKGETEAFSFRSETLGKLRPPPGTTHVDKNNVETKSVKGSPLWIKKPDLQLFYNASRDWARMYLPEVLMGIYTPDEIEESEARIGPDHAIDRGTIQALRNVPAAGIEGAPAGYVDAELAQVAAGAGNGQEAGSAAPPNDPPPATERTTDAEPEPKGAKRGKSRKAAVVAASPKEVTVTPPAGPLPPRPKTKEEWVPYARAHIAAATSSAELDRWWNGDLALRNGLGLTAEERMPVQNEKYDRVEALKDEIK